LLGSNQTSKNEPKYFLLFLLFLFISSGYNSTYSFFLLVPFIITQTQNKLTIAKYILVFLICALPPRLFTENNVFLQHYKLYLMVGLFAIIIVEKKETWQISKTAGAILVLMIGWHCLGLFSAKQEVRYEYAFDDLKMPTITDYAISGEKIRMTYYGYNGGDITEFALPENAICNLPLPAKNQIYIGPGNILYSKINCHNGNYLFLSDVGRGVGLFHLFSCAPDQFPLSELKSLPGK
jgi:hypothetical protein